MEADVPTVRVGATPTGLTAPPPKPPKVFTGRMPFMPPNQQRQSTEGKDQSFTKTFISGSAVLDFSQITVSCAILAVTVKRLKTTFN